MSNNLSLIEVTDEMVERAMGAYLDKRLSYGLTDRVGFDSMKAALQAAFAASGNDDVLGFDEWWAEQDQNGITVEDLRACWVAARLRASRSETYEQRCARWDRANDFDCPEHGSICSDMVRHVVDAYKDTFVTEPRGTPEIAEAILDRITPESMDEAVLIRPPQALPSREEIARAIYERTQWARKYPWDTIAPHEQEKHLYAADAVLALFGGAER